MQVIDSMGNVWTLSETENRYIVLFLLLSSFFHFYHFSPIRDLFKAAQCGLGVIGIISTVTVQCVDAFLLQKRETSLLPLEYVWKHLHDDLHGNDYYMFYWVPEADLARIVTFNRFVEDEAAAAVRIDQFRVESESLWHRARCFFDRYSVLFLSVFTSLETLWPQRLTPLLHGGLLPRLMTSTELVEWSAFVLEIPTLPNYQADYEFYVPYNQCRSMFDTFRAVLSQGKAGGFGFNGVLTVRFIRGDDIYLSPFYTADGEATALYCAFDLFTSRNAQNLALTRALQEVVDRFPDATTHWGKMFLRRPSVRRKFPQWSEFLRARERLDPDEKFMNEYVRRLLYGDGGLDDNTMPIPFIVG
jgi:L-gulonolactone oxidase